MPSFPSFTSFLSKLRHNWMLGILLGILRAFVNLLAYHKARGQ